MYGVGPARAIPRLDPELCALCALFYGPPEILNGQRNPAAIEWHRTKGERRIRAMLAEEGVVMEDNPGERFTDALHVAARLVEGDAESHAGFEMGLTLRGVGIIPPREHQMGGGGR